jgi:hypothetical protein
LKSVKLIGLVALMAERRDDTRRIVGEEYAERVSAARQVLRGVAAERKVDLVEAAYQIAREMEVAGQDCLFILCALMDECEAVGATS